MHEIDWRCRAVIDVAGLRDNVIRTKTLAAPQKIMAMVKADAYGHGMKTVVTHSADLVDAFAVATLNEAIELRSYHQALPVICMAGFWSEAQILELHTANITSVVSDKAQIKLLEAAGLNDYDADIWLKINTGMNRSGVHPAQTEAIFRQLQGLTSGEVRVMSHFSNADIEDDDHNLMQLAKFFAYTSPLSAERSITNSASILLSPEAALDWARPGIMLYGGTPVSGKTGMEVGLKAVMHLQARLLSIRVVNVDEWVGYGATWVATEPTAVGLVSCGYGDGYPRSVSDQAYVIINGQQAPIIGRVSMDSLSVDVTSIDDARVGDVVELWGSALSIDTVAMWANTISYELMCKVTARPERVIIGAGA